MREFTVTSECNKGNEFEEELIRVQRNLKNYA
jgi:hypothetical protein